jgi:hypothetical protein
MDNHELPDKKRRQILALSCTGLAIGVGAYLGMPGPGQRVAKQQLPKPKREPIETPAAPQPAAKSYVNRELFVPQIGTDFSLKSNGAGSATCRLLEVSPGTEMKTPKGTFVAFSLIFARQLGFLHEGGTCMVTHPDLEPMEIFLTPVGDSKKKPLLLEACFTLRA